jgi:IclR family acetate operon transcriptional repressor
MRNASAEIATEPTTPYLVRAVAKTAAILEAFEDGEALSLTQLAQRTGIPKPSVFRLATTLESVGLLDRDRNGSYALGVRFVSLARVILSMTLPQAARPVMEQLHYSVGHSVNLAVLHRGEMLFVDVLESRCSFRMASTIGAREPLHSTALGKAVAAHLPAAGLVRILAEHPLRALTPNTITSRPQLDMEFELVRKRGYATDIGECYVGAHAVGAAVFNRHGVVGGISISASSSQLPVDALSESGAAVAEAAHTISRTLGGDPALWGDRAGR